MNSTRHHTVVYLCSGILCLCGGQDLAWSQSCANGEAGKRQEEAPVQRVGTVLARHERNLSWLQPADFVKLHYFRGQPYQPADHEGLDFIHPDQAIAHVPVYAAERGTVVYVQRGCPQSTLFGTNYDQRKCGGGWGNHVVIRHPNGWWTRYAHLQPDTIQVEVSQSVQRGELLAEMGNSGQSNMRHLHFEVGVAISFAPCAPPQSFQYVYDPVTHMNWLELRP